MNRNTNNRFSLAPQAKIERAKFHRNFTHKTTFESGRLIPLMCEEVLPGDTVNMDYGFLSRMSTPIYPVMDNLYLDFYFFYVPNRLIWQNWEKFNGYNEDPWIQETEYEIPYHYIGSDTSSSTPILPYSLGDYLGLPTYVLGIEYSVLPVRGIIKVWNDWFRDENLQSTCYLNTNDESAQIYDVSGYTMSSTVAPPFYYAAIAPESRLCPPVAKFADYFTTGLPGPQKGDPVSLPLGDTADVTGTANFLQSGLNAGAINYAYDRGIQFYFTNPFTATDQYNLFISGESGAQVAGLARGSSVSETTSQSVSGSNLYVPAQSASLSATADLSTATAVTINQLRLAFQTQKLLERDARGGTRYIEIIESHFGVKSPDARLQRSEYLGGKRFLVNMQQVLQTSSTDDVSPQGNTAAYSATSGKENCFTKSFVEHGYLYCFVCARADNTYQQGLNRMWSRRSRFDFYWPVFAHIGEQPVLNKEIYAQGTSVDDEVFAYQEAWAEYRYSPSRVSGAFRSNLVDHGGSLDSWHYAQYYTALPVLGSDWIEEGSNEVARTLAVGSAANYQQFIIDVAFRATWTRPMPVYSVPELVDHF